MTATIARSEISEPERWSVSGGSVARRLQSWSEILATTHLAFDISPTDATPTRFAGVVSRHPIDDLMLVDCAASQFRGRRSAGLIGADGAASHEHILAQHQRCKLDKESASRRH